MTKKKKFIKDYIMIWKKYEKKPTQKNLENFLGAAIHEYTIKVTGHHLCLPHLGIKSEKDFDEWIKNDLYFREWFKKEFYYWLKFEDEQLVLIDTRLSGLKYHDRK